MTFDLPSFALRHTSDHWMRHVLSELLPGFRVLDPDGWDRHNFRKSYHVEKISFPEFMRRVLASTIRIPDVGALQALEAATNEKEAQMMAPPDPTERRTSRAWHEYLAALFPGFVVMDPDGWNRRNFQWSWHVEEITLSTFLDRTGGSTTIVPNMLLFVSFVAKVQADLDAAKNAA